jgi:signal transduction histidine kinase
MQQVAGVSIVHHMTEERARDPMMAQSTAADPAGLRGAREQHKTFRRALRGVSPILGATIVAFAVSGHPRPGAEGKGLAVSITIAAVIVGFAGATRGAARPSYKPSFRASVIFGGVVLAASIALMWAQPTGPGAAGALVGVLFVARTLPARAAIPLAVATLTVLIPVAEITGHGHGPNGVLLALIAGFTGMVFLAGRLGQANDQAERLLTELEASRAGEARAAGLAERQRLAREMHDVLAHSLSGLLLKLEGARMLAARDPADYRLPETIDEAHRLARSGLEEARRAIGALRGDQMPGPDRLPELAEQFGQDRGIPCRLTVSGTEHPLGPDARLAVYRVAQEALTNIAKHAHPDRVEVRLDYLPDATRLAIEDFAMGDNAGAAAAGGSERPGSPSADSGGYGLTGMRERAELLGGALRAGRTGTGFLVELEVPA